MDTSPNGQSNTLDFLAAPPPPINQPPAIFGSYSADGSPIPASLSGPIFTDDVGSMGMDDGTDQGDPKRRRIARACDMCRKKKIKCDGKMPSCTHCQNYKTECIFTQVEKKRQPPKGAKYIEGLENRLGRMESLLRLSGLLSEGDAQTDLGTLEKRLADKTAPGRTTATPSRASEAPASAARSEGMPSHQSTPQQRRLASPTSGIASPEPLQANGAEMEPVEEVEALSDMMCSLVTNNCGETRYIGSLSRRDIVQGTLTLLRIVIWVFYLLAEGHTMGEREDRRHRLPRYDTVRRGRRQMDTLEARRVP